MRFGFLNQTFFLYFVGRGVKFTQSNQSMKGHSYRHAMLFIFSVQLSDLFWSMRVLFGILDCLPNCLKILSVYRNVRSLKIIYPKLSYSEALEESGLVRLDTVSDIVPIASEKDNHGLTATSHNLHKNSFVNRCLFNYR